ncbi:hypothetical protein SRB5_35380 [Streptomyces sp. RB5]|uniref:Uncharacterized protein n=1 Tax=Streptomyces smaragdinus TaxID=2585196 RepID=A0A7K0CIS7_9ACTN|nr:hypothetical protein [Streptomyces smaragdinus]MQY13390.1 hypothetical protein [Streptomyces smaragdinus]
MDAPRTSPHRALDVSRRGLIGAAAATAAATALPWATAAPASAAAPADTAIPSPADLPLTGGPDFPVGTFWPPHPFASTPERYAEVREAGFDFIISGNYAGDGNIFQHQLRIAADTGLKMLISDDIQVRNMSRWFSISDNPADSLSVTPAEADALYKRAADAYGPYASLAGFNFYDEPGAGWFPSLARALQIARARTPGLLPYVNLFPSTDANYYQSFVDVVKPSLVSFDRYPLLSGGREDADYFRNWAAVRKAALSADLPAWVFIQTLLYDNHRTPTAAELLWQINISLAYGAKGIQYFTYWTPEAARGEGFGPALITVEGERTERWYAARDINTAWLHPVGRELKPLLPETVTHANEPTLPAGAVGFTPGGGLVGITGQPVVLGTFTSRDTAVADRWVLVANRWHNAAARATLTVDPVTVAAVDVFDPARGAFRATTDHRYVDVGLAPGEAVLLKLRAR